MYVFVYVYVYVCVCICVCVGIYVCVYAYIYIHTQEDKCIYLPSSRTIYSRYVVYSNTQSQYVYSHVCMHVHKKPETATCHNPHTVCSKYVEWSNTQSFYVIHTHIQLPSIVPTRFIPRMSSSQIHKAAQNRRGNLTIKRRAHSITAVAVNQELMRV
jgi:hypothetical protein